MTNGNSNLKLWHFALAVAVLLISGAISYTRVESKALNNEVDLCEYKIEVKEKFSDVETDIEKLENEIDVVDEIKINLKSLMNHFDLPYIEE